MANTTTIYTDAHKTSEGVAVLTLEPARVTSTGVVRVTARPGVQWYSGAILHWHVAERFAGLVAVPRGGTFPLGTAAQPKRLHEDTCLVELVEPGE